MKEMIRRRKHISLVLVLLTLVMLLAVFNPGVSKGDFNDAEVFFPFIIGPGSSGSGGSTLENDGSYVGLDGVGIGALSGQLDRAD